MWRTERGQPYPKLVIGRLNVRRILQRRLNERTAFIFNAAVVGANSRTKNPGYSSFLVER
jgi:hypothetical protein